MSTVLQSPSCRRCALAGRAWRDVWLNAPVLDRTFRLLVLVVGCLLLGSDSPGQEMRQEDRRPAPSSSLSKAEACALGVQWKLSNPGRRDYCEVANTGSMAPVLDSRCVLLLEKSSASDLRKNDISIYQRGANSTICHRVVEVRPDGVLFEGDNNRGSDGWIPPDRILWRVVSIIFTQR